MFPTACIYCRRAAELKMLCIIVNWESEYPTLYCVTPGTVGDAASGICRQACAHPRFENREILGRHRCELWTDARPPKDGRPVVVEIGECPLHGDLPRFDGIQTRTNPQVPH